MRALPSLELFAFFMLTGIFSTLLLPETKGKSLEDLSGEDQEGFVQGEICFPFARNITHGCLLAPRCQRTTGQQGGRSRTRCSLKRAYFLSFGVCIFCTNFLHALSSMPLTTRAHVLGYL